MSEERSTGGGVGEEEGERYCEDEEEEAEEGAQGEHREDVGFQVRLARHFHLNLLLYTLRGYMQV